MTDAADDGPYLNIAAGLVVEILSPLQIAVPDHPHNVSACVQGKWARLAQQLHIV